jgi:hypothetical protein
MTDPVFDYYDGYDEGGRLERLRTHDTLKRHLSLSRVP